MKFSQPTHILFTLDVLQPTLPITNRPSLIFIFPLHTLAYSSSHFRKTLYATKHNILFVLSTRPSHSSAANTYYSIYSFKKRVLNDITFLTSSTLFLLLFLDTKSIIVAQSKELANWTTKCIKTCRAEESTS